MTETQEQTANRPVKRFKHGTLTVSVWANHHEGKAYFQATLTSAYKVKDTDEWKESKTIPYRDLPAASVLLVRASNWIAHQIEKDAR